jgi:hypothetical protein
MPPLSSPYFFATPTFLRDPHDERAGMVAPLRGIAARKFGTP